MLLLSLSFLIGLLIGKNSMGLENMATQSAIKWSSVGYITSHAINLPSSF